MHSYSITELLHYLMKKERERSNLHYTYRIKEFPSILFHREFDVYNV